MLRKKYYNNIILWFVAYTTKQYCRLLIFIYFQLVISNSLFIHIIYIIQRERYTSYNSLIIIYYVEVYDIDFMEFSLFLRYKKNIKNVHYSYFWWTSSALFKISDISHLFNNTAAVFRLNYYFIYTFSSELFVLAISSTVDDGVDLI